MNFSTAIKSLSVVAALALAGCMNAEAPPEPASRPLTKTAYEAQTGCPVLDKFLGSFGEALTCQNGDFEECLNTLLKNSKPVLACYDIHVPAEISGRTEFEDFVAEFNAQMSKYDNAAGQQEIVDCLCGGGSGVTVSTPFSGSSSTSGTGFSSSSSTSGTGYSSSSSASGTGFSSGSSTSASGFSAK